MTANFSGFVQARYTMADPAAGPFSQTLDVPLARLAISGSALSPNVSYFFQVQASTLGNSNQVSMLDAWLGYKFSDAFGIQAGRMLLPYSRQFYTHPGNLLFADLSVADYAFNLSRALAFGSSGTKGRITYYGAVANSIRALDGAGQQNDGRSVAVLGRVEVRILAPYGYMESVPASVASPQFSVGFAAGFNPVSEASVLQNTIPGDRIGNATVDSGFRWKRFTSQAAIYGRRNHLAHTASARYDWGSYEQAGFYILPKRLEVAGRIGGVKFNGANNPQVIGDTTENSAGLNYYIHSHNLKLQSDYSWIRQHAFVGDSTTDHRFRSQLQLLF